MWRGPIWLTRAKVGDVASLVLSITGVVWQMFFVPQPNVPLLIFLWTVMAGPGVVATWLLAQSSIAAPSVSSPSPPPQPPPSPSSSSSGSAG